MATATVLVMMTMMMMMMMTRSSRWDVFSGLDTQVIRTPGLEKLVPQQWFKDMVVCIFAGFCKVEPLTFPTLKNTSPSRWPPGQKCNVPVWQPSGVQSTRDADACISNFKDDDKANALTLSYPSCPPDSRSASSRSCP